MQNSIFILLILMISCSSRKNEFQKYEIEKGILTYSLTLLKDKAIAQRVYFSNYGATEYFEYDNKEAFPTTAILKIDSLEYFFTTDSMAISKDRGGDTIFEKLTKRKNSRLSNKELSILNTSDTLINDKECELIEFKIKRTGQTGKAALWKGIPLWVNSTWEEGLYENLTLIELDLVSDIPVDKTRIMDYVDTGEK